MRHLAEDVTGLNGRDEDVLGLYEEMLDTGLDSTGVVGSRTRVHALSSRDRQSRGYAGARLGSDPAPR
jgi:hypothetical protein